MQMLKPILAVAIICLLPIALIAAPVPPPTPSATGPASSAGSPAPDSPLVSYLKQNQPDFLNGLVGCWSGEGSTVDSVSGNAVPANSNLLYWPGIFGKAFLFNGRDTAILLPDPEALRLSHSLSISAWLSIWSVKNFLGSEVIFRGDDRNGLDPYYLTINPASEGRAMVQFAIEQVPGPGDEPGVFLSAPIPLRQWVHVAGVLDDATGWMRLYVDGKMAAAATVRMRPFHLLDPTQRPAVAIGNTNSPAGCPEPFHGLIDELMVFNRALSPDEVLLLDGLGKTAESKLHTVDRIIYSRSEEGPPQIWSIQADGVGAAHLTHAGAPESFPAWSPDGRQALFSSQRDGTWQLYTMNEDGSDQARLSSSPADEVAPDWSADGTRIAFVSARNGKPQIYVMNADGSNVQQLTGDANGNTSPTWSPDGSRIAFVSTRDGVRQIYTMNPDGSYPARLTVDSVDHSGPVWKPDGRTIAYARRKTDTYQIWTMDVDGRNKKAVTDDEYDNRSPAWSPDGSRIAFCSNRTGRPHIYLMDADGSHITRLTTGAQGEDLPRWVRALP